MSLTSVEVPTEDSNKVISNDSSSGNIVSISLLDLERLISVQRDGERVHLSVLASLESNAQRRIRSERHLDGCVVT